MSDIDKRLIEDYLPIEDISAEAAGEKSVRKGNISTLHLWWARRPLTACRAAVYGALVSASHFGKGKVSTQNSRETAAKFVKSLCKSPGSGPTIAEAKMHIWESHAQRLTRELGRNVTAKEIAKGNAPRPKVLDFFAGGGAIPLEASRLGCDAYAIDLNPVAHVIELCTLVHPQKFGKPDRSASGSGPDGRWAGLAEEVRYWGNVVCRDVKKSIGDLYPLLPDPDSKRGRSPVNSHLWDYQDEVPAGFVLPVAYLWTRTVVCKNPHCKAVVPLVRQTWLSKKDKHCVGLKRIAARGTNEIRFEVVESRSAKGLEFDPGAGSEGGNATCAFCGTVVDIDYVKTEGIAGRIGIQPMAMVCTRPKDRN